MTDDTSPSDTLHAWLDRHGLGQYHDAMAAEDLTVADLADLDDRDLKELGLSMGHRKALRRALAEADAPALSEIPQSQRRQLTVLFCDLAGSTHLASTYDAEDMAAILQSYHIRCYEIIKRWGGRPLGTQGDGVIACFGLPKAQENDAERCLRAAMEMSQAISDISFDDGLKLQSRIGVATGRLFVRGAVEEPGNVVGETLNLASRLQDCAALDTVVLSRGTKRLVEKAVRLTPMGSHHLKGFDDPVDIWTVNSMIEVGDRLMGEDDAPAVAALGRQAEIAVLREMWEATKAGQGQVAVISGDAGIGKSHLLEAVRGFATADDHVHIRYFSAPFYENSAMFPVIAQLNHAAGIADADTPAARLAKIRAMLPGVDDKGVALIAALLSVDAGDALPPLDMTAAQQKLETFAVLQGQLARFASEKPVLILAEDAHWADPTSLEFLSAIVPQIVPENRVMLVVTHRPSIDLGWEQFPAVRRIALDKLEQDAAREIVHRVMGDKPCPPELMHEIIQNADGVPLFVEELALSAAEQIESTGYHQISLPSSLEDSLRERLDRLTEGKSIIQMGAVFGRRFYLSLMEPLLQMGSRQLATAAQEPIDAKIIMPAEEGSDETMLFRHALVQQAAYSGLLRAQRKEMHARIAALLLEHRPALAETEPETLARHFAGSGQYAEAIQYLIAAGQRATSRAAQVEATNHYLTALEHLKGLPPSKERDGQEVLIQALLGGALMATRGFAAPDVYNAFARARELCLALGDNPMYCSCLYGLLVVNTSRGDKAEAEALAEEMLATFGEAPVPSWAIAAHFSAGLVRFFGGQIAEAEAAFERAVALYSDDQHGPLVEQFGDNLAEFSICYLQWTALQKGEISKSAAHVDRVAAMADELNNKNAQTRAIAFRMGRMQELGEVAAVAEFAPQVIDISMRQGYPYWATAGQIGLGWATALGGSGEGVKMIEAGLGFFDMIGQATPQTYWRTYLVQALIAAGDRAAALAAADEALARADGKLDVFFTGVMLRMKGDACMMAPADPDAARDLYEQALAFNRAHGQHYYALQAACALARLEPGDEARLRDLQDAVAKVDTTTDYAALQEARSLLADLGG